MSKSVRLLVAAVAALAGVMVFTTGVAEAGIGAGASPSFPEDTAIGGVRVGETYSASIAIINFNTPNNEADVNTVCNFGDTAPPCTPSTSRLLPEDPGINLVPACGVLGNDSICADTGADPGVFSVSATGTGRAGSACDGMTFDIRQTDPTFDTLEFVPTGGAHVTLQGQLAACAIDFTYTVVKMPLIDSDPAKTGVQTIHITDNVQWSGNINASARGTTPGTTVLRAQPTIVTTASGPVPLGAGTLSDTATVSGRVSPVAGATITFALYGPNDPSCSAAPIFTSTVPQPVADGPIMSEPYTPSNVGTHRWIATYSGDANNDPASGACGDAGETVVVDKAQPAIATTASSGIRLGAAITDTATVTGRVNPQAGATVDFALYGPNDPTCTGTPVFTSLAVPYPVAGGPVSSDPYTPTATGTYLWIASYSGDANNLPATGACGDTGESSDVDRALPTLETVAGPDVSIGEAITDTATVTGRVDAVAATIDFALYGPNDDDCSGTPVFEQNGVAFGPSDTSVTSDSFTPTAAGTYRWVATYSGDVNNEGSSGTCGDPAETVDVLLGSPTIVTTASASVPVGVGQMTDAAVVNGRVAPQPGATIDFRLYGPGDTTCSAAPVFEDLGVAYPVGGGQVRSAIYTPTVAGTYRWVATYSGDANNTGATGECGDPAETVVITENPQTELPATGSETGTLLQLGGGFILAGGLLAGLGTRRRRPHLSL